MALGFDELVKFLRKNGFEVSVTNQKGFGNRDIYKFARISGRNIDGGFCTENNDSYSYIRGRIAADHVDCFDKWSKCPLVMKLPVDGDLLLKHLKHLGSKEGYELSNTYGYLGNNPYPYEMKR